MSATNWTAGDRLASDRMANMLPIMQDWTPEWVTSSGINEPDYGNSTLACRWAQCGDLVVAHFDILFGSSVNFGGGGAGDNWYFSLPVDAATNTQAIGEFTVGTTAGGARVVLRARLADTHYVEMEIANNRLDSGAISPNTGLADAISPFTWNAGSSVRGVIEYETA